MAKLINTAFVACSQHHDFYGARLGRKTRSRNGGNSFNPGCNLKGKRRKTEGGRKKGRFGKLISLRKKGLCGAVGLSLRKKTQIGLQSWLSFRAVMRKGRLDDAEMRKRREILSKTRLVSRGERSLRRRIGQEEEQLEGERQRIQDYSEENQIKRKKQKTELTTGCP